ncbi:MAG: iron exporter MbfA [Verrucomicrobiota bacterium]
MRSFETLSEREVLSLAIALEEEDAKIYDNFAEGLRESYPDQAARFDEMRKDEVGHGQRLLQLYQTRFGEHLPLVRREDIRGFIKRRPVWLERPLSLKSARKLAELMELETERFYDVSARRATDPGVRQLLGDLAAEERHHALAAAALGQTRLSDAEAAHERRRFALQVIQPGLAGLMDGSVSTLAPLFAACFATKDSGKTFLVGLAASIGAGISMGFAEALSDDGALTGRGHPWKRGWVCGAMTAAGGLGHTLPFFPGLFPNIYSATTVAIGVVCVELGVIAWIRHKYMDTPWPSATLQVVLGGALVFMVGWLIGSS